MKALLTTPTMTNFQDLFDNILFLLEKNADNYPLAKKCLEECALELAFTPAKKDGAVKKDTLLTIYKKTDSDSYLQLKDSFESSNVEEVLIWYVDTEKGGYSIYTNSDTSKLVGIRKTDKTLQQIRKEYFEQKEALQKIGEKPAFNYADNEITFINKKLVE